MPQTHECLVLFVLARVLVTPIYLYRSVGSEAHVHAAYFPRNHYIHREKNTGHTLEEKQSRNVFSSELHACRTCLSTSIVYFPESSSQRGRSNWPPSTLIRCPILHISLSAFATLPPQRFAEAQGLARERPDRFLFPVC